MSEDFSDQFGEMPTAPPSATATGPKHTVDDFLAYAPSRACFYLPCKEPWPNASVDARLPKMPMLDETGTPVRNAKGKMIMMPASQWLEQNRSVECATWAPGWPELIEGRLAIDSGWKEHPGATTFNLYRPPQIKLGDASRAERWVKHWRAIYPDDADHIISWLAQRVQHPEIKINHALVLGGAPGIGKDSLLQGVKDAVGPWNFREITLGQLVSKDNVFLRSVILRLSEARDVGESGRIDRFGLYDHTKVMLASPPEVLRVNEKYLREYYIFNCVGMVVTTNYRDALYLPRDDRRHYVAFSECSPEKYGKQHWTEFWAWYEDGGFADVAAYLHGFDLTNFDPKAPPPKTAAFWAMVEANSAPEEAELADALDALNRPKAFTLEQLSKAPGAAELDWLFDPKARRSIPHRLECCGYLRHPNPQASDPYWIVGKKRQAIYVRADLDAKARTAAAMKLCKP
jgi:hypothetical protein